MATSKQSRHGGSSPRAGSGSPDVPPLPVDQRPADWWKQPVPRGVCPCCGWKTKITKVRWQQTNAAGKKEWWSYHTCRANRCKW
jgi:hypothetical protein